MSRQTEKVAQIRAKQRLRILKKLTEHGELSDLQLLKIDPTLPVGPLHHMLRHMEKENLVTSRWGVANIPRTTPRRIFKITDAGKKHVESHSP